MTPQELAEETARLVDRKSRLVRLIQTGSPDIIVWYEMRLVRRSMRRIHGWWWPRLTLWQWISGRLSWWRNRKDYGL
jgi:hypothetical protein